MTFQGPWNKIQNLLLAHKNTGIKKSDIKISAKKIEWALNEPGD